MEVKKLKKNSENNRYNYLFVMDVGYREMAKLLETEIGKGHCMSFSNGMGYTLRSKGSTLVLKTNRCRYSPSVELSEDESFMIQNVFSARALDALHRIYERTHSFIME